MKDGGLPMLMITELFLPTKGGTAVLFEEECRALGGEEVLVVAAQVPGSQEFDRFHPNTVHRLALKRYRWLKPESLCVYLKLLLTSLQLILTHRVGVVSAGRVLPEGLVAWIVGRLTRRPVVVYAHGEELTSWGLGGKYRVMRFTFRHADLVIANSDYTKEKLINMLGLPAERAALLYPTVDSSRFRPGLECEDLRRGLGLGRSTRLILSVGRLQRRKGFDRVIQAMPSLVAQGLDVHYALIGIGEDLEYLQGLAADLCVGDRTHFLGHVNADDLPRWYNACDLFAMPNRDINGDTEGFGIVYLEAAASGKPAVAGARGGTGSAVVDGETGLRVDAERVEAVASALARLLRDADLAGRKWGAMAVRE